LRELFAGLDPRDFLNSKSPAFKKRGLKGKPLTAEQAVKLMAEDNNLLKRPVTIVGSSLIAGFDRDQLRRALN
ncbi:MAG: arsenate reductase family protein, partial [Pseudomonadota bacterium]